jgi:hypothetical protein
MKQLFASSAFAFAVTALPGIASANLWSGGHNAWSSSQSQSTTMTAKGGGMSAGPMAVGRATVKFTHTESSKTKIFGATAKSDRTVATATSSASVAANAATGQVASGQRDAGAITKMKMRFFGLFKKNDRASSSTSATDDKVELSQSRSSSTRLAGGLAGKKASSEQKVSAAGNAMSVESRASEEKKIAGFGTREEATDIARVKPGSTYSYASSEGVATAPGLKAGHSETDVKRTGPNGERSSHTAQTGVVGPGGMAMGMQTKMASAPGKTQRQKAFQFAAPGAE